MGSLFVRKHLIIFLGISAVVFGNKVFAADDVIEIPEEELAQESVLPLFDRVEVVKSRNVVTENKFEVVGYFGWNTTDPIYNQMKYGFNLGYHTSEKRAFSLNYAMWSSGLNTQYTNGLSASPYFLDFSRAPKKKYSAMFHYEHKMFYGKVSFTKRGVVNLSTYPIVGAGFTAFEHKNYPAIDVGIGQKFYFTSNFSLRADLKLEYGQYPSPYLNGKMQTGQPVPSLSEFSEKYGTSTILDVGASFIF